MVDRRRRRTTPDPRFATLLHMHSFVGERSPRNNQRNKLELLSLNAKSVTVPPPFISMVSFYVVEGLLGHFRQRGLVDCAMLLNLFTHKLFKP